MTKKAKIYNGKKTISSISDVRETGQLHVKKCNWNICLTPYIGCFPGRHMNDKRHMKRCSISLIIKEMKIKITIK